MHSIGARLLSISFILLLTSNVLADTLRIGTWDREAKGSLAMTSEAILTQAYAELNQPVEFVELPVRRALDMLLKGQLDGNFYRVAEIAQQYPMLFRIESALNIAEIRVYRNNPKINPENWAQVQKLRIGYIRGVLMIERNLLGSVNRVEGASTDDVFKLLSRGLVDIVLVVEPATSPPSSSALAAKLERSDVVLDSVPLYHYLAERHRDIGIRLNAVLKRMQDSGQLQKIRLQALQDYP